MNILKAQHNEVYINTKCCTLIVELTVSCMKGSTEEWAKKKEAAATASPHHHQQQQQQQLQQQTSVCLPSLSVVEYATVEVGHDVFLAIVDQQWDAVVLQGPLGVSSGHSHQSQESVEVRDELTLIFI